ncbi:MAG: hypothetical protein LPK25_13350 [Cyclobacteriaceae bacterium]|nr:hypothetical protein [Cyclobacteriaceae bacterium]
MTEDWRLLVESINNLKQEPSFVKDYIWPIVTGLLAAVVGAATVYWTIRHQEKFHIEKEKINSGNLLMLKVIEAQANLVAWKQNYINDLREDIPLFDEPIRRLLATPRQISDNTAIEFKIELIVFTVRKISKDENIAKWQNLTRVMSMISNFNQLQLILSKRSIKYESIVEILARNLRSNKTNPSEIQQLIPNDLLKETIDLTEKAIVMIDDVIIEMDSFIKCFSEILKLNIDKLAAKRYGSIMVTVPPPEEYSYLYERCGEVNYQRLSEILGDDVISVKQRYARGQMTSELAD